MKYKLTLLISLCLSFRAFSQHAKVTGIVTDSTSASNLSGAVIYILRAKDSILLSFTRSGSTGTFEIDNLPNDSLIVLIGYPHYADYTDKFITTDEGTLQLRIPMILKIKLLEEVVLKRKIRSISVRGDTTEYNAESFHLPPNASAQDLLKKLPGIQVTKNGQIIAQGEKISKILVDGEEFFSTDPSLVTQSLPAAMIAKVQVFDDKSELAKLTGTNGGPTSKVLNIKLKNSEKAKYFGKINVGMGTNDYYNQKSFFNSFKDKRKLAFFTNTSNTGRDGFYDDQNIFTANAILDVNGNIGQIDPWNGNYSEVGLPKIETAGVHYNNHFANDKTTLSGDYRFQHLQITGIDSTLFSYNLADQKNFYREKKIFNNTSFRNSLDGKIESKVDSMTSLKINFSAQKTKKDSRYFFQNQNFAEKSDLINSEDRNLKLNTNSNVFYSTFLVTKNTRKQRRNILFSLTQNYKDEVSSGYLKSDQIYFNQSSVIKQQTDQFKTNKYKVFGSDAKLTYTEPVSKTAFLLFNLEYGFTRNKSMLQTFNRSSNNQYNIFDPLYSNDLVFNSNLLRTELGYTIIKSKYYLISGLGLGQTKYSQKSYQPTGYFSNTFTNLFPNLLVSYKLAVKKRITFGYDGLVNNPSINQVQGSLVNIDPLNIVLGNPNLKPSFSNIYKLSYSDIKPAKERELTAKVTFTSTSNDIGYRTSFDSSGRKFFQYVNINGNRNIQQTIAYSSKITKSGFYLSLNANAKEIRYVANFEKIRYIVNNLYHDIRMELSKSRENRYEASIEFSKVSSLNKFKIFSLKDISYTLWGITTNIDLFFKHGITFHSDLNMNFYKKNFLLDHDIVVPLWNMSVAKLFFKNNNLEIKLSTNDLLNRNQGISPDNNASYTSQSFYTVVKRYGMLSIQWNFNKTKK